MAWARVDDLDGTMDDVQTIEVAVGDDRVEIELSEANRRKLGEVFAPYLEQGRRVKPKRVTRNVSTNATNKEQNQAIREWARKHGHKISDRGRIPENILTEYHNVSNK